MVVTPNSIYRDDSCDIPISCVSFSSKKNKQYHLVFDRWDQVHLPSNGTR